MPDQNSLVGSAAEARSRLIDEASLREWTVTAGVIVSEGRVDDGPDRLVGNLADSFEDLSTHLLVAGIDEKNTFVPCLNGDICPGASQQINIPLNLQRLDLELRKIRIRGQRHLALRPNLLWLLGREKHSASGSSEKPHGRSHQIFGEDNHIQSLPPGGV